MTKNSLEIMGRIAVFRARESEPGTPQTAGGVSLDLDQGSAIKSALAVEHDRETIHGAELPTRLYAANRAAAGRLSEKRAKPDFLAFVLAYFFGECASAAAGDTAYEHVITPTAGLTLPSFTAIQRRGRDLFTERLAGNYLEAFTLELADGWVSLSADLIGVGAREVNYEREVVAAAANAAAITLAANGVAGSTPAERLANVYRVRAKDTGSEVWKTLGVTAVSGATPAVITFSAPLGSGSELVNYHLDYLPTAPAWCVLPPAVDESPLKLTEARIVVDGYWDGSSLEGGEELKAESLSFTVSGKNHLELRHFPGASGPAAGAVRGGRELTIALGETLRDTVREYQADHPETERLAVALLVQGAEIDPGGARFGAELIFPACGILSSPVTVQNQRLAREGDLIVMDDGTYGGAVIRCFNQQESYL